MFESDPSCFTRTQAGCQESLNALLRQHAGLVQAAVRRQVTGGAAFEDLLQAGRAGLWRAILGFEPQRGTRFATYAWPSIVRAIWRASRAHPLPPATDHGRIAQRIARHVHAQDGPLPHASGLPVALLLRQKVPGHAACPLLHATPGRFGCHAGLCWSYLLRLTALARRPAPHQPHFFCSTPQN
jgi:hypothetical protein